MKRYYTKVFGETVESSMGEWVRYSDAETEIEKARRAGWQEGARIINMRYPTEESIRADERDRIVQELFKEARRRRDGKEYALDPDHLLWAGNFILNRLAQEPKPLAGVTVIDGEDTETERLLGIKINMLVDCMRLVFDKLGIPWRERA